MSLPIHRGVFFVAVVCLFTMAGFAEEGTSRREPVHPRRNVDQFPPIEAKIVRFTIQRTTGPSACIDELEIYGPDDPSRNLALAANGARTRASGTLTDYRIHSLDFINDGLYGNPHSWICNTVEGWVEIELPAPTRIDRVVWSRDREGKFTDRLVTGYKIEVAREPGQWQPVASSADRLPLVEGPTINPGLRGALSRFPPPAAEPVAGGSPIARDYVVSTWQTAQGIPANTVTAIVQTRDGWLWIGTTNGLARFDGIRFTLFGESQGLPGLNVSSLFQDHAGTLWVGTEGGGLARWDGRRFQGLEMGANPVDRTVLALTEDAAGTLWIGTPGGLFEYREGQLTRRFDKPVVRLAPAPQGGVWYVSGGRLWLWDGQSVSAPNGAQEPSRFTSIGALAATPGGDLWFGGANGYVARYAHGVAETFGEGQAVLASTLWDVLPGRTGDVWLGTAASGLARLREGKLEAMTTEDGLPSNSIGALCEDREGDLWIGTAGGGLVRLRPRRVAAFTTRDGLSHNVIMALAEGPDGAVWIGTDGGGVNRWQNGKFEPFAPSYVLENEIISSIAAPADGVLWLGTLGNGLFRCAGGQVERVRELDGLPGRRIAALRSDSIGGLWIGSQDAGVSYLANGQIIRPHGVEELANLSITSILEDRTGAVWFATDGQGIARLDGGKLQRWTRTDGLVSDFCRTLYQDPSGTIWIGTSGGLARWRAGKLEGFAASEGLPQAAISQILSDSLGNLWLGTNRGISRVTLAFFDSAAIRHAPAIETLSLNQGDGLPSLECTGGYCPAGLRTRDGRLCFGTIAGLAVIDPQVFSAPPNPPPVVIEGWTVGGHAMPAEGVRQIIPSDAGPLEFRFTALSYTAPARIRFRYRLEGLDREWSDAGLPRTANYAHLPPGDFKFRVQASLDGSPWGESPATIVLRMLPPWWREPWVMAGGALICLLVAGGVARAVTRRRFQQRLLAVEQQYALERERTRIARDIHDDLGANLTQIALRSAAGREQRNQPEVVEQQFAAIAATAENLVQSMDAIVWAVNPRHDSLESLARYLTRFAEDFFAQSTVRLRLDVPLELPDLPLTSEVRHNLFLASKEALNNVLRHSKATEVWLKLSAEAGRFSINIEDNGRGFTLGTAVEGDGLGNLRRRLAECGGDCEIASTPDHGTRIHLSIPLPFTA